MGIDNFSAVLQVFGRAQFAASSLGEQKRTADVLGAVHQDLAFGEVTRDVIRTDRVFIFDLGPPRASRPQGPLCEKRARCVVERLETHECVVDLGDLRHKELNCIAAISRVFCAEPAENSLS